MKEIYLYIITPTREIIRFKGTVADLLYISANRNCDLFVLEESKFKKEMIKIAKKQLGIRELMKIADIIVSKNHKGFTIRTKNKILRIDIQPILLRRYKNLEKFKSLKITDSGTLKQISLSDPVEVILWKQ
jgi:hypothetical protein